MIIAVAASENHLKSNVDPHFGRCDWYCLYDTDTLKSSFIENTVRYQQEQAGCDAAKFLLSKGIKIAIAGRFGAKVIDVFRENDVQMIIPQTQQTISKIISSFKNITAIK
jgi:predicted Fe-Mo cluster-binding NifX family protein